MVLRYILNEEQMGDFSEFGVVNKYMNLTSHELLNATFINADKYDVAELREMVVKQIGGSVFWGIMDYKPEGFLKMHYNPIREAFGGNYPKVLYPAFAKTLERCNEDAAGVAVTPWTMLQSATWRKVEATQMKLAAIGDQELMMYLFGHIKL